MTRAGFLCLALVAVTQACTRDSDSTESAAQGLRASVLVIPFGVGDSMPATWNSSELAESLAVGLSRVQGLSAESQSRAPRANSDFTLAGDVDTREGRMVIAARLRRSGEDTDVWSSTYWRADEPLSRLVGFLTVPVTEAVFRDLARRAATSRKEGR